MRFLTHDGEGELLYGLFNLRKEIMKLKELWLTVRYRTKNSKIKSKMIIKPIGEIVVNSGKITIDVQKIKEQVKKEAKIDDEIEIIGIDFDIEP